MLMSSMQNTSRLISLQSHGHLYWTNIAFQNFRVYMTQIPFFLDFYRAFLCGYIIRRFSSHRHRAPNAQSSLDSLHVILSSSRPNHEICGEIADIVGLHDMELVMNISNNRTAVLQEVCWLFRL